MKKLTRFFAASLAVLTVFAIIVSADTDSSSDPLVTLSYIHKILMPEVQKEIQEGNEKVLAETDKKIEEALASATADSSMQYEAISLNAGETLLAEAACEIILRSGKAFAVSPFENQGLSDVTAAGELLNGAPLAVNHLLLIPRADGRGLTVNDGEAWLMVRGSYTIHQNNS